MATHKDCGSDKANKTLEEEEHHRTHKHSGTPESPQSHAPPLSPASLSWEDEAFPISTSNTDTYAPTKGSEENTSISQEVPNLPGPSMKEGKIPGYGKFAAFLQEEEDDVEDFLDEADDNLYDPEEEEVEVSSPGRRQLVSVPHPQDLEEDNVPVQNRKVSISDEETKTPSNSAQQKGEAKNIVEEEKDAYILTKDEKDIPECSTNTNVVKSGERPEVVSYKEKQQGTVNVYDEKGEAGITVAAPTHASMPSIHAQDQMLDSSSDEKPMSSCKQDEEAHVLTKQQESANTFTQETKQTHTPKDHNTGTGSPSQAVKNTVGPSSEIEENCSKPSEQEEHALTERIQQGESLLQRLHVVQQKHQSPEVSEEFPVMINQSAGLAGDTEDRERRTSLTGPDIEDSTGEEKDGDDSDAIAGPSHRQPSPESLGALQVPGDRVRANAVELHLSDGDDQSDSGVSADFSPCGAPEPQASAAAPTVAAPQPAPGTPAQQKRHPSSGQEGNSQVDDEGDGGHKGSETEQMPILRDALEGQSSFAAEGTVGIQEGQGSLGKKEGQQVSSKVIQEEEAVWMGKVMGEYIEGSVRKFNERRKLFESFQQAKTAESKPPPVRTKRIIPTSFSAFSLSSVSTRHVNEERIRPSVSVMERARSLEQLSQSQETGVPWHRDSGWGNQAEVDERDRIIVEGDVTLVHRRRSLRPSHSSESLYGRKGNDKHEEGVAGEEDEDEDESSVLHRQNPFFKLRPSLALRPDVARDIRDAREREKELRRLRRGLYGSWKNRRHSRGSASITTSQADSDFQSRGKLELVWPPPSPTEKSLQSDQTQELRPLMSPSQKAQLWQRWQMGTVNGHMEGDD